MKLSRLSISKNHLLWLCTSLIVPLVLYVIYERSITQSPSDSTEIPSAFHEYALFAEFEVPPRKCYQLIRWPNNYAYCDFFTRAAKVDVSKFYQQELSRRGWLQLNAEAEGWKSPTAKSVVVGVFKRGDLYFFLEMPERVNVIGDKIIYRLTITTLVQNDSQRKGAG